MLATKDIASLISNPKLGNSESTEQLKEYTKKFPYCSLFSILYLKSLSNSSDIQFEEELVNHSYRISDRSQLYNLIKQHATSESNEIVSKIEETEFFSKTTTEDETVKIVKEVSLHDDYSEIKKDKKVDEKEEKEEITLIENESKTIEIPTKKETDVVEESILQHALSANYHLSELDNEEIIELNKKNNSPTEEKDSRVENHKTELTIDTKQSFKSWLSANENYTHSDDNKKPHIPNKERDTYEEKTKIELLKETQKPKKAFFSPMQKAKESLNEEVLPVSETLAKIYALQGNFPKAISAYIQLSLINPEKKIFFALRIKELEQKLKHK